MQPSKPVLTKSKHNITIAGPTLRSIYQSADNLLGIGERSNIAVGTCVHALILWAMENIPAPVMRDILVKSKAAKEVYSTPRREVSVINERMGM